MHRNARQLLDEVLELVKELEVYSGQRDSFFSGLKKLDAEYDSGRLAYIQYEEKQKAALHGRARQEWSDYYRAYIFALVKKIEFIISQAIALVHDDDSIKSLANKASPSSLPASQGVARLAKHVPSAARPVEREVVQFGKVHHVDVFNIDNEIARLKGLFESKAASPGEFLPPEPGKPSKAGISIQKFEELAQEIEETERKGLAARLSARKKSQPFGVSAGKRRFPLLGFVKALLAAAGNAAKSVVASPVGAARLLGRIISSRKRVNEAEKAHKAKPVSAKPSVPLTNPGIGSGKQSIFSAVRDMVNPGKSKKGIFVEEIIAMEKTAKISETAPGLEQKEPAGLAFGWFSAKGMIRELTEKFRSRQQPILAEQTAIPLHVKKLKEMRRKIYEAERLSGFDATLLAQEARRVKKILEVEKPEVYQGSSVGLIANLTVRKISLFLVDTFPEFFGFLYNGLRAANVKVLSNTYVNIMILSSLFVTAVSFLVLTVLFFIFGYPIYQIFLRAAILSVVAGFALATIFYAYPFMKIKDRRRKIMTNLPFAINHMAAVATSGVPPGSMFELIAASSEYSEICIEVKKIVDFINIFGYDLLTAVRTVAATTPSPAFKEFLDGIVSTIETGGDLDRYLRQEADQATLTYNLERQRYNETVSTYSDIYTGVLIAAPLFFVAAMAMVNLLGGTLGGVGVDVVMAVGAYAVIPLLNIGFLLFLQVSQPDV